MNKKEPKNKFVNVYKDHWKEYYLTEKQNVLYLGGFLERLKKYDNNTHFLSEFKYNI